MTIQSCALEFNITPPGPNRNQYITNAQLFSLVITSQIFRFDTVKSKRYFAKGAKLSSSSYVS